MAARAATLARLGGAAATMAVPAASAIIRYVLIMMFS
jgi:hypothetical protein